MNPHRFNSRTGLSPIFLITALVIFQSLACEHRAGVKRGAGIPTAGEPDRYCATVVRTIDDGTTLKTIVTREFRSEGAWRQEWTEQGHNRALIWEADRNRGLLLDLDSHEYVEIDVAPVSGRENNISKQGPEQSGQEGAGIEAVDRAFDDAQSPEHLETLMLPDDVIDGHPCSVYEQRATFRDGHTEITRCYRASDLAGLALKVETLSKPGGSRIITERRDVRTDIPGGTFAVPPDYKKLLADPPTHPLPAVRGPLPQ